MQLYGIQNPWLQILCVTIAISIVFCVWYLTARNNKSKKQMQRSIETCLGIYFVYLFGLLGILAVCVYLLMAYINKRNKEKNKSTPAEIPQLNLDDDIKTPTYINLYEETTNNTKNAIIDKANTKQPPTQSSKTDINIYDI